MYEYDISICDCSFFFFKQKTAYEMRISDWSSDVCSYDLRPGDAHVVVGQEDEAVADVELATEQLDLADHLLARLVGRVGLAGEHELHRPAGVGETSEDSRVGKE